MSLLDIDGSLSSTEECAKAIEFSLRKLRLGGRTLVLSGQTTDSGGGGVLDGLARELNALGLTVEMDQYLVAPCAIHALNLQLSDPTSKLIGDGGPTNRNAVQMLHSVYDLQGYVAGNNFQIVADLMTEAQEWTDQCCAVD